jgi:hypothetical protein
MEIARAVIIYSSMAILREIVEKTPDRGSDLRIAPTRIGLVML